MKKWLWALAVLLPTAARAEEAVGEATGSVFNVPGAYLLILAVVALVVALAVVGGMKSKLKTAKRESAASNYIRKGSLELTVNQDCFLYRTEERRKIEQKKEN